VTAGETLTVASGVASANAVQLSGDATAADNAEAFFDGTGYAGTNNVIPTVTAVTNAVSANVTQISGDATAADNLEAAFDDTAGPVPFMGIIDQGTAQSASATGLVLRSAAAFADDVLIGATLAVYGSTQGYWQTRTITDNALSGDTVTVDTWTVTPSGTITYKIFAGPPASATALPAVNVMQVGGSTTDVSALATNVAAILVDTGTTLDGKLNTIDDFLDTEIAAILADTNELQTDWANGGRLDLLLDGAASAGDPWTTTLPGAYGAGTAGYIVGSNLNAPVGTVDTVVDAIKAKTDSLTFTTANQIDARLVDGAHGGSSATLTMRKLTVSNTTNGDPAVAITASGTGNAHGVSVTASGGGKGVAIGAASVGLSIDSSAADAVQIQGGTDSDGLQVSGNGTGVDIRADITGNLTGNVSGSVGSVTATVDANILEVNSQGIGASKPYDTAT
jgi:hypothetical protein